MSSDDRSLADVVQRIDGPIDLDADMSDRVLGRALAVFDDAVESEAHEHDDAVVREFDPAPHRPGQRRSTRLVAASIATFAALATVLLMSTRASEPEPADLVPAASTLPATSSSRLPASGNSLGYLPLNGSTFRFGGSVATSTDRAVTERTGEFVTDTDQIVTVEVRRSFDIGLGGPSSAVVVRLEVGPDGVVSAPLEFLDPPEFGGTCTGGTVSVAPVDGSFSTTAECDGINTDVAIEMEVGEPAPLPILETPVVAIPTTFTIRPDVAESADRAVTLWFTEQGLVRRTHDINGTLRDLDLDVANLVRMEETP